ncbi:MAG: glutathione S-transferase family protein [Gammaproteobacteria bacterium]|nr:glutathione S-transferase family protein [Gammaproteobacteria bacterium]
MKLYDNDFAPSPRRVRMFIAEKGLEAQGVRITRVPVDIAANETQSAAFLELNPLGEVPVLELDDGARLQESLAICRYLESLHPEPCLFGATPLARARIEAMTLGLMFRVYVPTTHAFRHTHRFWQGRVTQVAEYGALAREQVLAEWQRIDGLLAARPFVAGDSFSFADIVAFTTLEFGKPSGIRLQPTQQHLSRWYAAIAARPSSKA